MLLRCFRLVHDSSWRALQTSYKYTLLQPKRSVNGFSRAKWMPLLFISYFGYPLESWPRNTGFLHLVQDWSNREKACVRNDKVSHYSTAQIRASYQRRITLLLQMRFSSEQFCVSSSQCFVLPSSWRALGKAPLVSPGEWVQLCGWMGCWFRYLERRCGRTDLDA